MDIWRWVIDLGRSEREAGRPALERLVDALPAAVVDDEYARAAALVPEGIALARSMRSPWLEVFFRHWDLQARVLHQGQGQAALADAVGLLEFSHREGAKDCPQSVCTVQDLCGCYTRTDGPGFTAEREAVSRETLARIDAGWPCYSCVGAELCSAMADAGRAEEALAELDRMTAALVQAGGTRWDFELTRASLLERLGRWEELLQLCADGAKNGRDSRHSDTERAINKAVALVGLGRHAEARAALPAWSAVQATLSLFADWLGAVQALVPHGFPNDAALGVAILGRVEELARFGCPRDVVDCAETGIRLALARGAVENARALLRHMEAALPLLARPLGAPAQLEAARSAVAAAEAAIVLPSTPDELLIEMQGERSAPEADLAWLEPALRRWPTHRDLALVTAQARLAAGDPRGAVVLFAAWLGEEAPDELALAYGEAALRAGGEAVPEAIARLRAQGAHPWIADWIAGRAAYERGEFERCREHLRVVLANVPDARNTRLLLAAASQRLDDHPSALRWLDEAVALGVAPGAVDWDRMLSGTLLGAWTQVRHSAERLGYAFPGEGPIEVLWHLCKVRVEDEDLWARRTGPVTARIISMRTSDQPQVWGRILVFRPTPLNEVDPEEKDPVYVYPWVADLDAWKVWTFEIDGVRPDRWPEIEAAMDAFGGECRVLSGEAYELRELPAVYACVVVPEAVPAADVHARLSQLCAGLPHPLVWPRAAERAGDAAAVARMAAQAAEYGIE